MENHHPPSEGHRGLCLKGQFLMAMPGLADPHFSRTVTCICEHTPDGAVGIVVNQLHGLISAKDVFAELSIRHGPEAQAIPIHIGGPVHMGEIFVLHGPPFGWKGCFMITDSLAMSNTADILEAVAGGRGPGSLIIALGCAGWGPSQLESEIRENAWLTAPVSEDILFDVSADARWEQTLRKSGIDPLLLSDTAGHA